MKQQQLLQTTTTTSSQFYAQYSIRGTLGLGSNGAILKAFDKINHKYVAIKKMMCENFSNVLLHEFNIMSSIRHPNILEVYEIKYVAEKRKYYLVMAYCENGSLTKNIRKIREMGENFVIEVCESIARAVEYLHSHSLEHRDISPNNILFDENWQVKLCDFGFAKVSTFDCQKEQSIDVGTLAFRDPNVKSGKYSKKCDIYSIGMVFDFIFRGQILFSNKTPFEEQMEYFQENKQVLIYSLDCPLKIKEVILKCLQKEQNQRYSAVQLLKQLKNYNLQDSTCSVQKNQTKNNLMDTRQSDNSDFIEIVPEEQMNPWVSEVVPLIVFRKKEQIKTKIVKTEKQISKKLKQSFSLVEEVMEIMNNALELSYFMKNLIIFYLLTAYLQYLTSIRTQISKMMGSQQLYYFQKQIIPHFMIISTKKIRQSANFMKIYLKSYQIQLPKETGEFIECPQNIEIPSLNSLQEFTGKIVQTQIISRHGVDRKLNNKIIQGLKYFYP